MSNLNVNTFYEYTNDMIGNFSGGTWTSAIGPAPHPVATELSDPLVVSGTSDTVVQMNAITIGGFNGLNN